MKITVVTAAMIAATTISTAALAESTDASQYAIGAKVGTLGLGLDLTYNVSDRFNARFNVNGGSVDADGTENDIDYKGNLKAQTIGGLIDYHPKGGNFRLSAGIYSNGNELDLDASGADNTTADIGGDTYDLSDANLNTHVSFKSVAPYLGVGWGNAPKMGSHWRFGLDAGVLFQGSPEAKLTPSGTVRDSAGNAVNLNDPAFQSDVREEEQNLNNDLKDFKAYPVISLGASYRF